MSYSHPDITFNYLMVLKQLLYYSNDYKNRREKFITYMLRKCNKMGDN